MFLTLTDLETHDRDAPKTDGKGERRFVCPLPACSGKRRDSAHRSLSLNVETGAWHCHRCGEGGVLRENQRTRSSVATARELIGLNRLTAPRPPEQPARAGAGGDWATTGWLADLDTAVPIAGTPGATYLATRAIPADLAMESGVLFCPSWAGHPAVLFLFFDRKGALVAIAGRYTAPSPGMSPHRTAGAKKLGVFSTPGALTAACRVIVEAPIDALSLAACGVPAIAIGGKTAPDWLPAACAFRRVVIATDKDQGGDEAAATLAPMFYALGAKCERLRPPEGKDWNDSLRSLGAAALTRALMGVFPDLAAMQPDPITEGTIVCCPDGLPRRIWRIDTHGDSQYARFGKLGAGVLLTECDRISRGDLIAAALGLAQPAGWPAVSLELGAGESAWRTWAEGASDDDLLAAIADLDARRTAKVTPPPPAPAPAVTINPDELLAAIRRYSGPSGATAATVADCLGLPRPAVTAAVRALADTGRVVETRRGLWQAT